jgi:hypothetical protein
MARPAAPVVRDTTDVDSDEASLDAYNDYLARINGLGDHGQLDKSRSLARSSPYLES